MFAPFSWCQTDTSAERWHCRNDAIDGVSASLFSGYKCCFWWVFFCTIMRVKLTPMRIWLVFSNASGNAKLSADALRIFVFFCGLISQINISTFPCDASFTYDSLCFISPPSLLALCQVCTSLHKRASRVDVNANMSDWRGELPVEGLVVGE